MSATKETNSTSRRRILQLGVGLTLTAVLAPKAQAEVGGSPRDGTREEWRRDRKAANPRQGSHVYVPFVGLIPAELVKRR